MSSVNEMILSNRRQNGTSNLANWKFLILASDDNSVMCHLLSEYLIVSEIKLLNVGKSVLKKCNRKEWSKTSETF